MRNVRAFVFVVALFGVFFSYLPAAFASNISASPLIIDEKASPRDILKQKIGLMNAGAQVAQVYTFVNNTDPLLGIEAFQSPGTANMSDSLANWIEITRGLMELQPGEKREVPMLIQVNLRAEPGMYHAVITFAEGGTRSEAEANIKNGVSINVNVEVVDDSKEILELDRFVPENTFVAGNKAGFKFEVKNIGNRPLAPKGEVRTFNRNGKEIATIPVNDLNETVKPSSVLQLASAWESGSRFGRYKAMLNIEYGSKQKGSLQDTVFFWLVPWKELLAVFFALLALTLSFAVLWHNNYALNQKQRLAHSSAHDFTPRAPVIQHGIPPAVRRPFSPASAPVSPRVEPKVSRPAEVPQEIPETHPLVRREIQSGTLRIQPKAPAPIQNSRKYVVNLKK